MFSGDVGIRILLSLSAGMSDYRGTVYAAEPARDFFEHVERKAQSEAARIVERLLDDGQRLVGFDYFHDVVHGEVGERDFQLRHLLALRLWGFGVHA